MEVVNVIIKSIQRIYMANLTATATQKIISVSVSTLKHNNIIDMTGDEISYENLTHSIEVYGVMEPIFITKDKLVISGNRRVQVSKDLLLEKIPAIIVEKTITPIEIEKLKIDFLLTHRNMSHLDIIQIYYYQSSVFAKYNEPYTEYMSKLQDCTQRNVQLKVRAGKTLSTLPIELKKIFQDMDRVKKVPMKTFKVMSELEETNLNNCVKEILAIKNLEYSKLASIVNHYQVMFNQKKRKKDIDEKLQQSKEDKEDSLNELNSSKDSDSRFVGDIKKVFQYEIKKSFNLDIQESESEVIENIKSTLNIDFTEEIELIKFLLEETK